MPFGYNFLTVTVADVTYDIPVHFDKDNPERTRLGEIPSKVLTEYEVVFCQIPFLLRRDRTQHEVESV